MANQLVVSAGLLTRTQRVSASGTALDTQLLAFEMLYSLIILQVYNGESDAISVLDDLQSVQKQLLSSASSKPKKSKHSEDDEDEDEEMDPSEILVDILLSFLSRQSILLKKITHTVFSAFASSVTSRALERCFDVLRTNEGLGGQQQLFEEEDDEADLAAAEAAGSEDEDDDDDAELDSDVEMLDAEEGELDSDVEILSNPSSEDSESSGDEDDDDNDNEPDASTLALEAALKTALDVPSDGDDDADMSDDAMLELDTTISRIFAQRKAAASKKSQQKGAKELIINFKSKVLDLLESFIKSHPLKPEAWDVVVPCLQLASGGKEGTRDSKIADKALGVIRSWSATVKKVTPQVAAIEEADQEAAMERLVKLLSTLLLDLAPAAGKKTIKTVSSASITASKLLVKMDGENMQLVLEVYTSAMKTWAMERGHVVEGGVFTDFVGWVGSLKTAHPATGGKKKLEEDEDEEEDGEQDEYEEGEKKEEKGKQNKKNKKGQQTKGVGKQQQKEEEAKSANESDGAGKKRKRALDLEVRDGAASKEKDEETQDGGEKRKKKRRGGKGKNKGGK